MSVLDRLRPHRAGTGADPGATAVHAAGSARTTRSTARTTGTTGTRAARSTGDTARGTRGTVRSTAHTTSASTTPGTRGTARDPLAHSPVEDVLGVLTGTFVSSLGLFLLKSTGAVTGGTAGISLLLSYVAPIPFGVLFLVVNLPFFVLAVWKKGWTFTFRTALSVSLVSGFSLLVPLAVDLDSIDPVFAVVAGNLLAGVALLILFRHRSSLGGVNILALILQERLGWRAGYVQMAIDVIIVACAFAVAPAPTVLLSAAGAVLLNLVLALNHRPGRYLGV